MARRVALVVVLVASGCAPAPERPFASINSSTSTTSTTSTTTPPVTTVPTPSSVVPSSGRSAVSSPRRHPTPAGVGRGGDTAPALKETGEDLNVGPPAVSQLEGSPARASWYARGARTANGEAFDPNGATFAHLSMAFGTEIRFCHLGRCAVGRCTDRGPATWTGRQFDLSRGLFAQIAPLGAGVIDVEWAAA